jgi:long-chain acyl-CoA synthetase
MKARLFNLALSLGMKRIEGQRLLPHEWLLDKLLDKLVRAKVAERFGGRLRLAISGGARLDPEVGKFFLALGLRLVQGYGQTEAGPVISANLPLRIRTETVGPPLEGVDLRIAEDGEICVRGDLVMDGYWGRPEETAAAIRDGWLHTGDIGVVEQDGYLRITDRKKDIIVTAGGKNIAPQPIENMLKTNKYVSQAVMLGDKRKFPVVLIVPDWDQLEKWAARNQIVWTSRAELMNMPTIQAKVEKEVKEQLKGLASYEMPKKVKLIEHDFSIERGELTPTLKVKRRVIDQTYKAQIDELYAGAD